LGKLCLGQMNEMNILNLPHDVLLCIFKYLSGIDKLNLNVTCQRFSEVLEERTLTRFSFISMCTFYYLK
jgi:hypothetical protein